MNVSEAIKKLRKRQKYLVSISQPVDRWYQNLIKDLEKYPGITPIDSPRIKEDEYASV